MMERGCWSLLVNFLLKMSGSDNEVMDGLTSVDGGGVGRTLSFSFDHFDHAWFPRASPMNVHSHSSSRSVAILTPRNLLREASASDSRT